ncbi:MAG: ATP-binding protein [Candidatus Kapabacteria bacterium]|jgi:type II secretory pathway predicted ATPase ExeA|nr:ATP-binding protein [Candidatus Kapabacteria bacterium]
MKSVKVEFKNPFRPGAGQMPPYLAGREPQISEFRTYLKQSPILQNLVLTGLRGSGKTVLLDTFKPIAMKEDWLWVGTDLSESASISEETLATRLIADLSVVTSNIKIRKQSAATIGFITASEEEEMPVNYQMLVQVFQRTPGLVVDKVKSVLLFVWEHLQRQAKPPKGIVFAYDEAQHLSDHVKKEQYPLALLLEAFQSIQKQNVPYMLVLTGLPTLFPKLVESRTFAERMFHTMFLDHLERSESIKAITKPIEDDSCPIKLHAESVNVIAENSGGYPYFIQFICREVYDVFIQKKRLGEKASVPINEIIRKLDADFFSGRYARATDRQRDLLNVIAQLPKCDVEFTVHEIMKESATQLKKPFSSSHINQMLNTLTDAGLVYKKRPGKYAFAVPLLGQFLRRQIQEEKTLL